MLTHPMFDPVALKLGRIAIHRYGLTYLAAFGLFLLLARLRVRHAAFLVRPWTFQDVQDLLSYGVVGVVAGGRLGYVLFYKPSFYFAHPLDIVAVWAGGMSFHGGLLGVVAAMLVFARKRRRGFLEITDLIAPCVPAGLACGRIGNFINGELWGRAADARLPWAMIFPQSGSSVPRHPSQLYEFALEGLLLLAVLWTYARRREANENLRGQPTWGKVSGLFLIGYGVCRFIAEWFREPDDFLGLLALGMSMGQWLCVPMVMSGTILWLWAQRRNV